MAEQGFTLSSPDFTHGAPIPNPFSKEGSDRPPVLKWMHPPEKVKSFALIMDDPDAPSGTFTHWLVANIPSDATQIADASETGIAGRNDFQEVGYGGPLPPPNHGKHRYFFRLRALDLQEVPLEAGMSREALEQAIDTHILDTAELMGTYER